MTVKIKLPFALFENKAIVHVSQVVGGMQCNCFCPTCHSPLIAVKGEVRQHHFRHVVDRECHYAFANSIYLALVNLIAKTKKIAVPECIASAHVTDSRGIIHERKKILIQDGEVISFDSITIDQSPDGINGEVLCRKRDRQLVIKIICERTNNDNQIYSRYDESISAVKIDLSSLRYEVGVTWEMLLSYLNNPKYVQWLNNVELVVQTNKLQNELKEEVVSIEKMYEKERVKIPPTVSRVHEFSNGKVITSELRDILQNQGLEAAELHYRKSQQA